MIDRALTHHVGANVAISPADIAARLEAEIRLPEGAKLTLTGITGLPDNVPVKRLVGLTCRLLYQFYRAGHTGQILLLALGDVINAGERRYGDTYTEAIAATGFSYQTVADAAWVTRKVPPSLRGEVAGNVTYSHLKAVAGRETLQERAYWLRKANHEGLSTRELAQAIRDDEAERKGVDPIVADAERALDRAREAVARLWPEQWAQVIVGALVQPLRQNCAATEYGAFVAELRRMLKEAQE